MKDRIETIAAELEMQVSSRSAFDPVSEITEILAAIPDRTAFLNAVLRTARRCFLSNHETILSYHKPTRRWFVEAAQDLPNDALEEIKGLSHTVIERTRNMAASLLIADTSADELLRGSKSVQAYNILSVLTAPIYVKSELWGLIYLANTSVPHAFDSESQRQVERFAEFAGMAVTRCEEFVRFNLPPLKQECDVVEDVIESVRNPRMAEVFHELRLAAGSDASVLLIGETGTGKDVLAHWVHRHSPRATKPLVQINCAELDPDVVEVELFGVESGVATGVNFREGKIKVADGGTVFLNEIGELPLSIQAKILRVIEERVVERVGGRNILGVDVRFICATNRDLAALVESGQFRRDLYFRINLFEVVVPPLRERRDDIPALARQILTRVAHKQNRPKLSFSEESLNYLTSRDWKGNIRELANLIERNVILSPADRIVMGPLSAEPSTAKAITANPRHTLLKLAVENFEAAHIRQSLRETGWIESRAARALGLPESTLRSKIKKHGIKRPRRL